VIQAANELSKTLRLAIPIAIGQLTQVVIQITDALMIGRLGKIELAASAFAFSFVAIFMVFNLGFTGCISTLVAQDRGAGRPRLLYESFRHGLWLSFGFGVFGFILLVSIIPVLGSFGQDGAVVEATRPYLFMLAISCIPMSLQNGFRQFSEGLGYVKIPMAIAIAGVGLNILFNFFLIFGFAGFPRLELLGAGISTLIARIFMAGILGFVVYRLALYRQHRRVSGRYRWRPSVALRCLRIGLPTGCLGLFEIGAFSCVTILVGWFGAASLAAHQVVLNMVTFTYVVTLSFGFAANIRVGRAYGERDIKTCRRIGHSTISFAVAFMSVSALLLWFFRRDLPSLYIEDVEVIRIGAQLIIVAAVFQIFDGLQAVTLGVLRGMGDVQVPMVLAFVAYWVLGLPVGIFFGFILGLEAPGVWIGLGVGLGVIATILCRRFYQSTRISE